MIFPIFKRKIKTFFHLDAAVVRLLPETLFFIAFARFALFFFSFKRISPLLGTIMQESTREPQMESFRLEAIKSAILIISKNVPWKASCYVQALAGTLMLKRRNVGSTLYMGAKKDKSGELLGHAWLRCGNYIVTGEKGHQLYTIIAIYSKN